MSTLAEAYSATGAAWQAGPGPIYDRLAEVLVAACPGGVAGRLVLDVGAGTGAATRAAAAAGADRVVAVDVAFGMLASGAPRRSSGVVADARALPFAAGTFGAAVAAFSLNHLRDPAAGLAEAVRVLRPDGGVVVGAYAHDDVHPVKAVVEAACARRGWVVPAWYRQLRAEAVPQLATVPAAMAAARAAGLARATAVARRVTFGHLGADALVAWRLGMAQVAPFVAGLSAGERAALVAEAVDDLGAAPPLVRSIIVLTARR